MIGFHDADANKYPNLALMKLSAWELSQGKETELYKPGRQYEKVYSSKVFTFTKDTAEPDWEVGGYGRMLKKELPDNIEHIMPDYSLYGIDYSMGFLTRGCPNKCSWCFVPKKEGEIRPHADFREFVKHPEATFLDNNVLASSHGLSQIEKLGRAGVKVDFTQGLDARLIDDTMAKLLSKLKWRFTLRIACDTPEAIIPVRKAIEHLRWNNVFPRKYSCLVMAKDIESTMDRLMFLKSMYVDPYVQPYLDEAGTPPSRELRRFARWVNSKQIYAQSFEDYCKQQGDKI